MLGGIYIPELIFSTGSNPLPQGSTITLSKPLSNFNLIRFDWLARFYGDSTEPLNMTSFHEPQWYGGSTKRICISGIQHRSSNVFYACVQFCWNDSTGKSLYVEYNKIKDGTGIVTDDLNHLHAIYGYRKLT